MPGSPSNEPRRNLIGRLALGAAVCLAVAVAGVQLAEKGPDGSNSLFRGSDSRSHAVIRPVANVARGEEVDVTGHEPYVPGWYSVGFPAGNDVRRVVEPTPTARPAAQVGEVSVTSAPVPPTPIPQGAPSGSVEEIICSYPWDCTTAVRVADCETGGTFNPYATGHEDERGWFQIRFNHWGKPQCDPAYLYDPVYNTACAYSIWVEQGWSPWSCY